MAAENSYHMTAEQFRRHGHDVIDWIAEYYKRIETLPVLSQVKPGEVRQMLPAAAPNSGEAFADILGDIDRVVLPGVTHWQSPNFFAYFPANASAPAILGDLLSSALGVQGMLWATSPACTELETHVLDWLVPMLGLPEKFLSTQRRWRGDPGHRIQFLSVCDAGGARARDQLSQQSRGDAMGDLVAYTSNQAHSSMEKAAMVAGIGTDNLAPGRSGRAVCHASRGSGAADSEGPWGRTHAVLCVGDCRDYFVQCD